MKTSKTIHILSAITKAGCLMLLLFLQNKSTAQSNIDSLKLAYDYAELAEDRIRIKIEIASAYRHERNYEQAILEYQRAIEMIPLTDTELKAKTISKLGSTYHSAEKIEDAKGAYKMAIHFYSTKKTSADEVARNYSLLGRCYYDLSNYDSAMVFYLKAEEIYETNKIVNRDYGMLFHFIGSVFKRQGNYDKACDYYHKEIQYGAKNGFKDIEVEGLYLSGICFDNDADALANDLKCLKLYEELGSEGHIGLMYQLIAGGYSSIGKTDSALYYQLLSLEIRRDRNEISHLAGILADIAKTCIKLGRLSDAKKYLAEAEEVALKTEVKKHIRLEEIYKIYYKLAIESKNYKEAVDYLSLTYAHRDSAMDSEHQNAIEEMALIYDSEKQEAELAIMQKDKELAETEKALADEAAASHSFYNKIMMVGGFLLLVAAVFVYIKYRESQKQKIFISAQKREMQFQKELVEAKNKDITDSMVYASSIQKAIITSEEYLAKMFKDFFVFYKPRDIVSGDFYWAYETKNGSRLIAVGDCTGHGVPGAMMSMLGHAFLNEIVIEGKIYEPSAILNRLRTQVKRALQSNASKDGMDMSFCKIEGNTITYAGANLPLYVLRNGELIEFKGNKQPIGYQPGIEQEFTQESFEMREGDAIYLFSDGYADQFGGEKGKKYKYKTFKEKLLLISSMGLNEQLKLIDSEFEEWKGDLEQLDDVCVIGIRV